MKKLLSIGLLLLSCTSETLPDFTLDSGVVCDQIDSLNEELNKCLSKSCYYQVPIDMNVPGDMNTVDYSLTNCDPDLEAVIETCLDIFSSINDCENGFPKRDRVLDLSLIPPETQDMN